MTAPRYTRRTALARGALLAAGLETGRYALGKAPKGEALTMQAAEPSTGPAAIDLDISFRMFGRLLGTATPSNTFFSPLSVVLALAMVTSGARGATAAAMAKTLGLHGLSLAALNDGSAALIKALGTRDPQVDVAIADGLWARQGLALAPSFVATLKGYYGAEIANLDFASPAAPAAINAWVSRKTHGLIPSIVGTLPPRALLVLINALYFKGSWSTPFPSHATTPRPFTLQYGAKKQLPTMETSGTFPYHEDAAGQIVSLPYGGGQFSMVILLPARGTDIGAFSRSLTPARWNGYLGKLSAGRGQISMPRFGVRFSASLIPALTGLGMGVAFGPGADFGGIAPGVAAAISEVQHEAVLHVTEAGTTAAAVTAIMVGTAIEAGAQPFTMHVDRPFVCAIRDEASGTLLFLGAIVDPQ